MYGIIEAEERDQSVLVLVLNLLRRLLETGKHRALTTGKVLAGVTVLTDLRKDLLHDDELIRNKREVYSKLVCTGKALDIQDGVREAEEIAKHRVVFLIETFQLLLNIWFLLQNTLLDNLIHGGRRQ